MLSVVDCRNWKSLLGLVRLPDREASLIKKEYCRLSVSPHSLQVTPSRARPPLVKGGQANWRPSLGLWGSTSLQVNKPPLHCGGVLSHWRPSLVASLHSEGPSHDCGRATRFWSRWLACRFMSLEVGVIWFLADRWLGR